MKINIDNLNQVWDKENIWGLDGISTFDLPGTGQAL